MSSEDGDSTPRAKTAAGILIGMKLLKDEDFAESNFAPQNRARTGRPISKNNPNSLSAPSLPDFLNSNLDPNRMHLENPFELTEWWTNYTKINESKYGNIPATNFKLEDDLFSSGSKRPRGNTRSLFASEDPGFQLDFPSSRFATTALQPSTLRFGLTDLPIPKLLAKHLANDKEFSKYSYSSGNQSDSEVSQTYGKSKSKGGTRKRNLAERDINREISTSRFRGVSKHRMTGKWEVAVWFNGKQQYLGGFEDEEKAARAYDLATLAVKGEAAVTNFPLEQYSAELDQLRGAKPDEVIAYIRRNSCCFTRGRSKFRGVSGQDGHWEARIGNFMNRKNASLGVYKCQEDAARMYDRALLIKKGPKANTNFPVKQYKDEVIAYLHQLHINGELDSYLATDGPNAGLEDIKPSQIRAQHLVHVFLSQINPHETFPGLQLEHV